jgi:hypothetical protein
VASHADVIGVPSQLLTVIQNMYSGDAYRLVDGLTSTAPICPSKGVKQGCPLSPILFALFLSDVGAALGLQHSTGRMGVPLQHVERGQSGARHVTHLLFADDLAVFDTSQERLQSQMHRLLRYATDKGLTVNVSKCAVLVTGMRGLGGNIQYGNDSLPNVGEFCYLGMWMNKTMSMSFASRRMCGSLLAAWRQVLPVAIEHGVRDMPHAMMLLVRTYVLPRAIYACQVWGPDLLQLSPCGQSSVQSELLSICKHVLGLRGSVAHASLLDEVGLQPLQVIWLKACVKFFATACAASRGNPLLWEAMRANVDLSKDCHKAWCARLAWFLKCIGVLCSDEMDMCNPPDFDMVTQAIIHWAGSCRQQLLDAGATVHHTYVHCFRTAPLGEEPRPHPYLRACLRIPHSLVLSMARFRLSSHNLGVELGRHQRVVWFARGCKRCAALGMRDLPVDDEGHLLFSCPATAVVRRDRRFALLPFTSLRDLMCCRDVYGVALFVHKCMRIADAAAEAAARQQPR